MIVVVVVERVRRKCPPAGGNKMKIGGFKTGHCYHKTSDAAIQQEPSGVSSGVWLPRLSLDDFDRVVQTTPSDCWQFPTCIHAPTWPIAENSHKIPPPVKLSKKCTISQPIASINKPVNIHAQRHSCHII